LLLSVTAVAASLTGWYVGMAQQRQTERPRTVTAAVARLEAAGLARHVVGFDSQGGLAQGAYVCDRPRTRKELWLLLRQADAPGWEGVLLIAPLPTSDCNLADSLREWGEMAAPLPPLLVFGDPRVVRRAVAELTR
jgi:hypothetical protein